MDEKIELLALERDFASLNKEEQALVLAAMPQEAFEHLRAVLLAARQMDAGEMPSGRLRGQLLKKMAAKPKVGFLQRVNSAQVPAWQAAAAVLLAVAVVGLWKKEPVQEKIVTEIQVRTDTLWQEKIRFRDRILWKEKIVYKENPRYEPIVASPEKLDGQEFGLEFPPQDFTPAHVGTSLGDAPELMDFFTQGDK